MIFDENAVRVFAQSAADIGNVEQQIYQRKTGEYMFCARGNLQQMIQALGLKEQVRYIGTVQPSHWPKKENESM